MSLSADRARRGAIPAEASSAGVTRRGRFADPHEGFVAAGMARFDLLRLVSFLGQRITKWDELCDRVLHRLMCYINFTKLIVSLASLVMARRL